jgi:2-iminobutanoate/2-iminopropanoate deaminase
MNIKPHYSPSMRRGDTLYVSGQLPIDPLTGVHCRGDIRQQTRKALENLLRQTTLAGGSMSDIVKTTAFITAIDHWDDVNSVYAEFFGELRPSRSIVAVKELHFGFLVEIEGVAVLKE